MNEDRNTIHTDEKIAWAIIEASPDAVVMTRADGTIRFLNERAEQMFGFGREELLGQPAETLVPERFREVHRTHRAAYRSDPQTRPMGAGQQFWGRRSDGSEVPVEISLSPIWIEGELHVLSAIRDISERIQAEARKREVCRALDLIEDGVFMFDAASLQFHYVNCGALQQVGYSEAELESMTPVHLKPEFDRDSFRTLLQPLLDDEVSAVRFTTVHRRRTGEHVPVEILLQAPEPMMPDGARACIELSREIGPRLRQEAEVARLHLQTAVFEDRERMARAMHDQVIGRLFGTGLALEATIGRATDDTVRARLRDAVSQIDATIDEIRAAVFDGDGNHIAGRSVSDEVRRLVAEHRSSLGFEPELRLRGMINELDGPIAAHLLASLREALTNVSRHAQATRATVTLAVDEDAVSLTVTDDGIGIPDWATSPPSRPGHHGLGNIVARATELGGHASATSEEGAGTTLVWVVPLELGDLD